MKKLCNRKAHALKLDRSSKMFVNFGIIFCFATRLSAYLPIDPLFAHTKAYRNIGEVVTWYGKQVTWYGKEVYILK